MHIRSDTYADRNKLSAIKCQVKSSVHCVNWEINCAYDTDGTEDIIVAMNSSVIIVIYVRFILRVITGNLVIFDFVGLEARLKIKTPILSRNPTECEK